MAVAGRRTWKFDLLIFFFCRVNFNTTSSWSSIVGGLTARCAPGTCYFTQGPILTPLLFAGLALTLLLSLVLSTLLLLPHEITVQLFTSTRVAIVLPCCLCIAFGPIASSVAGQCGHHIRWRSSNNSTRLRPSLQLARNRHEPVRLRTSPVHRIVLIHPISDSEYVPAIGFAPLSIDMRDVAVAQAHVLALKVPPSADELKQFIVSSNMFRWKEATVPRSSKARARAGRAASVGVSCGVHGQVVRCA